MKINGHYLALAACLYMFSAVGFISFASASDNSGTIGSFDVLSSGHWLRNAYPEVTGYSGSRKALSAGTSRFGAAWRMSDALERVSPQMFGEYRRKLAWEFAGELALVAARSGPDRESSERRCFPEVRFDRIMRPLTKSWPRQNELPAHFAPFYKVDYTSGAKGKPLSITDVSVEGHRTFSRVCIQLENPDIVGRVPNQLPVYRLTYDGFRHLIRVRVMNIRQDAWYFQRRRLPMEWSFKRFADPVIDYVAIANPPDDAELWVEIYLKKGVHVMTSRRQSPLRLAVDLWESPPEDYRPIWRVRINEPLKGEELFLRQGDLKKRGFETESASDANGRTWLELTAAFDTASEARQACAVLGRFSIPAMSVKTIYY